MDKSKTMRHKPTLEAVEIRNAIKKLCSDLKEKRPFREEYIPEEMLQSRVTEDAIGKWIEASGLEKIDLNRLKTQIFTTALRTFCILVEIDCEDYIKDFIQQCPQEPDRKLWWTTDANLRNFLQAAYPNQPYGPWLKAKYEEFYREQWKYLAIEFKEGESRTQLPDEAIFPYLDNRVHQNRGTTILYRVDFDGHYLLDSEGKPVKRDAVVCMQKGERAYIDSGIRSR